MEYIIEEDYTCDRLISHVCIKIDEGYQPIGGVSVCFSEQDGCYSYTQAMVRHESKGVER